MTNKEIKEIIREKNILNKLDEMMKKSEQITDKMTYLENTDIKIAINKVKEYIQYNKNILDELED